MKRSVLFLDLATVTGWAEGEPGSRATCGRVQLAKPGQGTGAALSGLAKFLVPRVEAFRPARIIFESPFVRGQDATRRAMGLAARVEEIAFDHGIVVQEANLNTIRKAVLGFVPRGNDVKKSVLDHARSLGYEPADDNAADALLGWLYACSVLDPRAGIAASPLFSNQ